MENSLEKLEQIMKPYFDKKEEIDSLLKSKEIQKNVLREETDKSLQDFSVEKNKLELRLERLRENKDKEIEEYIKDNFSSQPSFYSGYGASIRKDLERAYEEKEKELIDQINDLDKKIKTARSNFMENIITVNKKSDYNIVYTREMAEFKSEIRKKLLAYQDELILDLKREKLNFDRIMLELSSFKYEYNDQHQVTNSAAWRELFEKSNQSVSRKNQLTDTLKKLTEYLSLTELTNEEGLALMHSLTPSEKSEYDRRKGDNFEISELETVNNDINEDSFEIELPTLSELSQEEQEQILDNFQISSEQPVGEDSLSQEATDENVTSENDSYESEDLLKFEGIYADPYDLSNDEENVEQEESKNSDVPIDLVDSYVPVDAEYSFDGKKTIVDNFKHLAGAIYNDIVDLANNLKYIKIDKSSSDDNKRYVSDKVDGNIDYEYRGSLDLSQVKRNDGSSESMQIRISEGVYINLDEINQAIDNYYNKSNKGQKFFVKEINQEITVSKHDMSKLKKAIKNCTTLRLIKDKKLSEFDVKRVIGKEAYSEINAEIGNIQTDLPEGYYISRDELLYELKRMFANKNKRLEWLKNISNKIKASKTQNDKEDIESFNDLQSDFNEFELLDTEETKGTNKTR